MISLLPELDLYLALYLITLMAHLALMSFPLGGSVLLCLFEIFRGEEITNLRNLISRHLALSVGLAITAGVAPLLFLEVVHPKAFSNAGAILGGWRPALLIPLTIAFYLAYLQKTESFRRWPGILRLPIRLIGLAALAAVGTVWIISRRVGEHAELWHDRYVNLQMEQLIWEAFPLMGLVLAAATIGCTIGCLWLIGGEQRRGRLSPGERFLAEETLLRLAIFVAVGLAVVCEILRKDRPVDIDWWILRSALFVMIAGFGVRLHRIGPGRAFATLGAGVALFIVLVMREIARREFLVEGGGLDMQTLEVAKTREGFSAFVGSFIFCATGIVLVLKLVRRTQSPLPPDDDDVVVEEKRA